LKTEKKALRLEIFFLLAFIFLLGLIIASLGEIIEPEESNIIINILTGTMIIGSFVAALLLRIFFRIKITEGNYKSVVNQAVFFSFINMLILLVVGIYSDEARGLMLFSIHLQFLLFVILFSTCWHVFWLYRRLSFKDDNQKNWLFYLLIISSYLVINLFVIFVISHYCLR